jgi:beta-carotene hydroxylase
MKMTDLEITQAATRYMGKPALATVLLAIFSVVAWCLMFVLVVQGALHIGIAFVVVSYLVYSSYTPMHEAVHKNIAGKRRDLIWLNELVGYLVANILGVSYTMHKASHMAHHQHTNVRDSDPDFVATGNHLYDLVTGGAKMVISAHQKYFSRVFPKAALKEKVIVIMEIFAFVGIRVLLATAYPVETLVLGVLANIAGVTLLGYVFAWLVHTPFNETERFKDTSTIIMPAFIHGIGTRLWLWQNYHSIHHLFPRVPFFEYQNLFEEIKDGMVERGAPMVRLGFA